MRLLCTLLLILFVKPGHCHQLEVGKDKLFSSITSAVEKAEECDTIIVHSGWYKEGKIIINKSLTLLGIDYPVLDGENKYQMLSLGGSNFKVSGFELRNSGFSSLDDMASIKIFSGQYVEISGNRIRNSFFGIYLLNCMDCLISNNEIVGEIENSSDAGNAIHLWKSTRINITGNKVSGHRDGIYFEFVTNSVISGNLSEKNQRYGLHFMFSHDNEYHHNTFRGNGAGVAVMYSHGVNMHQNNFIDNWGGASYGLLLKEITDSKITDNNFSRNSTGLLMEGTSRIFVNHNQFSNNGWALRIQASCLEINFIRNNFRENSFDVATNGSLVLNKFNGNYWDKYDGYDLNRDGIGDIPYRPVDLYSMVVEQIPFSLVLYGSLTVSIMNKTEKVIPGITPEALADFTPLLRPQ